MDPLLIPGIILILAVLGVYLWADQRQVNRRNRRFEERRQPHELDALSIEERNRKLEHKMGIGPYAGREDYCDLDECRYRHDHEDVDEETRTGRRVGLDHSGLFLPF